MFDDTFRSTLTCRWAAAAATFGATAVFSWGISSPTALAPQPAQAVATLSGSTGATTEALFVSTTFVPRVLKWPSLFTGGSTAAPGTLCSNVDLFFGDPVTMHIQVVGTSRRCVPTWYPPIPGQPAPPPPTFANSIVVTQPTRDGAAQAVELTAKPTTILKWQELWSTAQPTPPAGAACSPVDMQAGESTTKHIQVWIAGSLWSRCVENTLPAYAN